MQIPNMKQAFLKFFILYSLSNCDFTTIIEIIVFAKMNKLSTYNVLITWVDLLKKRQLFLIIGWNYINFKYFFASIFYLQLDCFKPYKNWSRRKIWSFYFCFCKKLTQKTFIIISQTVLPNIPLQLGQETTYLATCERIVDHFVRDWILIWSKKYAMDSLRRFGYNSACLRICLLGWLSRSNKSAHQGLIISLPWRFSIRLSEGNIARYLWTVSKIPFL